MSQSPTSSVVSAFCRGSISPTGLRRPEWTPLLNVANQLVWSADGRSVHTVFVDGRKVVDDYRLTTLDAGALYERAQRAGEAIAARSGLPDRRTWPQG